MGRSDLFLKLEIIKKIVGLIALFSTMWFGVMPMAYSLFATSVLSQIINSWPNRKLLNYPYIEQIKDMLPQIVLSLFMGVIVFCVQFLNLNNILTLGIQVLLGIGIYIGVSWIFKLESLIYLLSVIKKWIKK